jgi:5-hydroxyisourate hydrolase-like protein (transthyretin family)
MTKRLIFLSLLLFLLSVERVNACSCVPIPPPCEAYKKTHAIFTGLVTEIDPRVKDAQEPPYAHFSIERAFKGITEKEIKMYQGTASGDCSLKFEQGKRYLIYADYDDEGKQFFTSFCTRTTQLEYAAEDLDYLEGLPDSNQGNRLSGMVVKNDYEDSESPSIPELISGVTVIAEREDGKRFEAVTNSQGLYKMLGLLPGRYTVEAKLPSYLIKDDHQPNRVEVPVLGCATAAVLARTDGRLSGTLLDAQGKPASGIYVELIASELSSKLESVAKRPFFGRVEETGDDGHFEFKELKPGSYLLGVNMLRDPDGKNPFRRTFFPGVAKVEEAKLIVLGTGEKLKGYELRMPPRLRVGKIQGVVVWANGKPIAKAYVSLQDSPLPNSRTLTSTETDISGHFTIKALEGQKAWLQGSALIDVEHGIDVMSSEPVKVVVNVRQTFLRLAVSGKPRRGVEIIH